MNRLVAAAALVHMSTAFIKPASLPVLYQLRNQLASTSTRDRDSVLLQLSDTPLEHPADHDEYWHNAGANQTISPMAESVQMKTPSTSIDLSQDEDHLRTGSNKWLRRLNTHEDAFSLHKIFGGLNVLTSLAILACGTAHGWTHVPDWIEPIQNIFDLSTIGIAGSASRMALKYRANEPQVRDVMLSMALSSVILALGASWVSPFHPDWMSTSTGNAAMVGLNTLGLGIATKSALEPDFVTNLSKNRIGKTQFEDHAWLRQSVAMVLSLVVAIPWSMAVYTNWFYLAFSPEQYANWMEVFCTMGGDNGLAFQYYLLDANVIMLLYGSFLTTLRDRKLIPPAVEGAGTFAGISLVFITTYTFAATNMLPYPSLNPSVIMASLPSLPF